MAQINSLSYGTYVSVPSVKPRSREWGGRARAFCESILVGATAVAGSQIAAAAGDCIRMFRIPANHKLVGGALSWSALGTGTAITVGDFYDCDRFFASYLTSAAAGCNNFVKTTAGYNNATNTPDTGHGYLFTCDTDILVTFSYGGAPVGVLTLTMETVVE